MPSLRLYEITVASWVLTKQGARSKAANVYPNRAARSRDPNVPEMSIHAPGVVDRAKEAAQSAPESAPRLALSSAPPRLRAARRTGPSAPG